MSCNAIDVIEYMQYVAREIIRITMWFWLGSRSMTDQQGVCCMLSMLSEICAMHFTVKHFLRAFIYSDRVPIRVNKSS